MGLRGWDEGAVRATLARNGSVGRHPVPPVPAAHAHRGQSWEEDLEAVHERYRREGRARIRKTDPPFRQLGPCDEKGRFTAVRLAPSDADFVGHGPGGVAVAVEAKSTEVKRTWWLGKVQPAQAEHLIETARAGGVAGVALLFSLHGEAFWVPALPTGASATAVVPGWCERAADPAREVVGVRERIPSVRLDDLRRAGLGIPRVGGLFDWLGVALTHASARRVA